MQVKEEVDENYSFLQYPFGSTWNPESVTVKKEIPLLVLHDLASYVAGGGEEFAPPEAVDFSYIKEECHDVNGVSELNSISEVEKTSDSDTEEMEPSRYSSELHSGQTQFNPVETQGDIGHEHDFEKSDEQSHVKQGSTTFDAHDPLLLDLEGDMDGQEQQCEDSSAVCDNDTTQEEQDAAVTQERLDMPVGSYISALRKSKEKVGRKVKRVRWKDMSNSLEPVRKSKRTIKKSVLFTDSYITFQHPVLNFYSEQSALRRALEESLAERENPVNSDSRQRRKGITVKNLPRNENQKASTGVQATSLSDNAQKSISKRKRQKAGVEGKGVPLPKVNESAEIINEHHKGSLPFTGKQRRQRRKKTESASGVEEKRAVNVITASTTTKKNGRKRKNEVLLQERQPASPPGPHQKARKRKRKEAKGKGQNEELAAPLEEHCEGKPNVGIKLSLLMFGKQKSKKRKNAGEKSREEQEKTEVKNKVKVEADLVDRKLPRLKLFHCEYCPKSFTTDYYRRCHLMHHTNERPYKCNVCGKGFRMRWRVRMHEMIHADKSSYPLHCKVCDYRNFRKDNMKSHVIKKHNIVSSQCDMYYFYSAIKTELL